MLQTFRNAPHLGKRRGSCAPAAQKRQLIALGGRKIGVLPGGKGFPVERQDFRRNIGSRGISSAVLPERAQGAGTGKLPPCFGQGLPMTGTLPGQGDRHQRSPQLQNGLAVFHGQIVVGLVQQGGKAGARADCFHRCLPGCRKAAGPGGKPGLEGGAVFCAGEHPGGFHQKRRIRGLGSEHQSVAPGGGQQLHPGPGKAFRPGTGIRGGQGEHEVGSAGQRGLHPHAFGQQGQRAPLGQPAAHGHRHPLSTQCLCLLQLPGVAVVEGIVFSNDPGELVHCEIYIVHTEITCVSFHLWAGCTKKHGYFVEPFARLRLENPWNLLYNISRNL